MAEFRHYPSMGKDNQPTKLTVASGPVIIEKNKVLLDKHGEDEFWKFPGGAHKDDHSFRKNAQEEARQELGLEIELVKEDPFIVTFERVSNGVLEYVILVHYLAKRINEEIKPRRDVREYAWHPIYDLPKDCAPNIKPAIDYFASRL